ncbi:MAG: leucine-rich repeat protein [Tannerella sp.]|nr:leucine-rich repeat protein [Tannerella sp.]
MKEKLLLLCIVFMCSLSSYGQSGQIGNIHWSFLDSVLTISGTGDMPDLYTNEWPWNSYRDDIVKVEIEDGVTSIGRSSFELCSNLSSVKIPNSVASIGMVAFARCSSLTNIEIPNTITNIGNSAFYYCINLSNVKIPDSLTIINYGVFAGCNGLTSVVIPDNVKSIGESAFDLCEYLTSITIPSGVTNIGRYAFYRCHNLTDIVLPDSLISIGEWAFANCLSLPYIEIPDKVTSIGIASFTACPSVKHITIPNSVTSIGVDAFVSCGMEYVDVYWDEPLSIVNNVFVRYQIQNAILIVPEGTKALYEIANGWKDFGTIIERPIPESISIYATLVVGSSIKLNAAITPSNTIHQNVTWSSSDTNIASVDATGRVTAITPGRTTITATTVIGGKSSSFDIEVEEETVTTYSGETANSLIDENIVNASLIDGTLTVNTPGKETIKVYSMIGTLIYSAEKQGGKQTYFVPNLSKEIYIVTGSSGWNAKLINK